MFFVVVSSLIDTVVQGLFFWSNRHAGARSQSRCGHVRRLTADLIGSFVVASHMFTFSDEMVNIRLAKNEMRCLVAKL